jgi:hypothetical protein
METKISNEVENGNLQQGAVIGSKKLRNFAANYGFRKDGYTHFFKAYNKEHARQLALEYQKKDNKGECKSDRLRLKSITEVVEG